MNTNTCTNATNIVHRDLSYKLMGYLFNVHNQLGSHHNERIYQEAIEEELKKNIIPYEREKFVPVTFNGKAIGKYYLDFIIEGQIALEVKTIDYFKKREWLQLRSYLQATGLKLGIIVNFNSEKLVYKRIVA